MSPSVQHASLLQALVNWLSTAYGDVRRHQLLCPALEKIPENTRGQLMLEPGGCLMLFQVNLASQNVCQAHPCWEEPSEEAVGQGAGWACGRQRGGRPCALRRRGFGMSIWGSTQNWEGRSNLASEQRASTLPWRPLSGLSEEGGTWVCLSQRHRSL